jgi:hypothetical protein
MHSILSTSKAGRYKNIDDAQSWIALYTQHTDFVLSDEYAEQLNGNHFRVNLTSSNSIPSNGVPSFIIDGRLKKGFDQVSKNGHPIYKLRSNIQIDEVTINNVTAKLGFSCLDIDVLSMSRQSRTTDFVINSCAINEIDLSNVRLNTIRFGAVGHTFSLERNIVNTITGLDCNMLLLSNSDALDCDLDNINGIKVRERMVIGRAMLKEDLISINGIPGYFNHKVSEKFNRFFANNDVKPERCAYCLSDSMWTAIEYDKKASLWKTGKRVPRC